MYSKENAFYWSCSTSVQLHQLEGSVQYKEVNVASKKNGADFYLKLSQDDDIFEMWVFHLVLSGLWMKTVNHNNSYRAWRGREPLCFLEINMSERLNDTGQMCLCACDTSECANENKPNLSPLSQKQLSANIMICSILGFLTLYHTDEPNEPSVTWDVVWTSTLKLNLPRSFSLVFVSNLCVSCFLN